MTAIPNGWPCALLATNPPAVADRQSAPSADDLLPQVLALTPRGSAWGSDGVGDGSRVSPVMRTVWRAIAAWVADINVRDFQVAVQAFPSAITFSLADWERDYGLPDPCLTGTQTIATRVTAVRGQFASVGGSSPAYFVCLALSIGYAITITEYTPFQLGRSSCGGPSGMLRNPQDRFTWKVSIAGPRATRFQCGVSRCGDSLLALSRADDLECLLGRLRPEHTKLVFDYSGS